MSAEEAAAAATGAGEEEEDDLEKLQAEIAKMEEEAARIAKETEDLEKEKESKSGSGAGDSAQGAAGAASSGKSGGGESSSATGDEESEAKRDGLSIYVGQVDYSSTPEELLAHFEPCGTVERVTIVCDKFTGQPKGFAYLEFQTEEAVENAMKLDGSEFKGRNLKVTHKRVNDPNYYAAQRGRGGGFRGGYRGGRGGYRGG
eukprot:CAMPEP_0183300792 /NCGR_PEP_ID=MMETSP0160_2-20130417/7101_1 /TAXON_ID=2839 ORGANISM="Odontella Sinensis, Strain Grunow 1884" /NCGR_SAMPLE_ID=MMETSP0160_2 /ASSEMBLY_ACC=CAM_ASM_000250 /LENGTH=201 /DNA_ID=CAMNT_0025463279 /DNA_START=60 /DNA_END=662 /DNA_ORIENTATION=-